MLDWIGSASGTENSQKQERHRTIEWERRGKPAPTLNEKSNYGALCEVPTHCYERLVCNNIIILCDSGKYVHINIHTLYIFMCSNVFIYGIHTYAHPLKYIFDAANKEKKEKKALSCQ